VSRYRDGGLFVLGQRVSLPVSAGFVLIFSDFLLVKRAAVREELPGLRAALDIESRE